MLWFCTFRRFLGFVTWPTLSFLNGFATCLVTVWIETKQRRALLLPYLLNLFKLFSQKYFIVTKFFYFFLNFFNFIFSFYASEALFRQAEQRKLIYPINFFESILFGFSTGAISLIISKNNFISFNSEYSSKLSKSSNFLQKLLKYSHGLLPEEEIGCWKRFKRAIKISTRNFIASFTLLNIYKLFNKQQNTLKFPLFLASMPLLFEFFTSITRPINFLKQKQFLFIALSSFLSMAIFWQNNTLALYTFWKMIELIYYKLICSNNLPIIPGGDVLLFCTLSSYLLGLAVLGPHLLRRNYYKFLCSATGNKFFFEFFLFF
uniref:Uncharacterized protein n=1 Tax=Meloidogyne enterolobii TaxID=390850 RepID=A0A6V7WNB6_MELEN|nr:unnamed protein product [Meloidogyne enterolobii]